MRPRLAGAAGALFVTLAAAAGAQDPGLAGGDSRPSQERYILRGQYREFHPRLSGKLQKGAGSNEGTLVDVDDDLALQDKRRPDVRGAIQLRSGIKLRGAWTPIDYDGDTEAARTFTYGNTRYERFSQIRTRIKGHYYSGDLEWDFLQRPRGYLGLLLGAKAIDVDTSVVSVGDGEREVDTLRAPIPVIGLTSRVYFSRVSLEAEGAGLSIGKQGSFLELDTSLRFHISDRLAVQGGYRLLKMDGKDERDRVKLDLGGFTFGLEVSL